MNNLAIIFDPSIGSFNKGDKIISEAVNAQINALLPQHELVRLSIHQPLGRIHRLALASANLKIVGGSNVASGVMHAFLRQNRWNLKVQDFSSVKNYIYMGAGWAGEKPKSNTLGRHFLGFSAPSPALHSFRDSRALSNAEALGLHNAINTACPTMWDLQEEPSRCTTAKCVVTTLTDNKRHERSDRAMLESLLKLYDKVYIWFQGLGDKDYFESLGVRGVQPLPLDLEDYTSFLHEKSVDVEYVGTRLHGGIRALQCGVKTTIFAVDHRAIDMAKDFALPVFSYSEISDIESIIKARRSVIRLPHQGIARWKQSVREMFDL